MPKFRIVQGIEGSIERYVDATSESEALDIFDEIIRSLDISIDTFGKRDVDGPL